MTIEVLLGKEKGGGKVKDNGSLKLRHKSLSFSHPLSLQIACLTSPQTHFLPTSNDFFSSSSRDLCSPPYVSAVPSRPVCSLLQKEPGWKAGGHTKPLLLYCRLQRKLKEGIVACRKPLHYISLCRQNNEYINAKKHALTHLLHFCAHSYLYLYLHVLPADAFTHRSPIEPVKEWAADKVGQRSYFYGCSLCGVCRVPKLPQKRGYFFSDLDIEPFPFILLAFQWCFLSSYRKKCVLVFQ